MSELGAQAAVVVSARRRPTLAIVLSALLHGTVLGGAFAWWVSHGTLGPPLEVELVVVSDGSDSDSATPPAAPNSNDAPVTQNTAPPVSSPPVAVPAAPTPAAPSPPLPAPTPVPAPAPVPPIAPLKPAPPAPHPTAAPPAPSAPQIARPGPSSTPPPSASPGQAGAGIGGPAGSGDIAVLSAPPPQYPALARRKGEEGRVIVRVEIGTDGAPHGIGIDTSSGSKILDDAAMAAVAGWRFRNDSGHSVQITVPIRFALRPDEKDR